MSLFTFPLMTNFFNVWRAPWSTKWSMLLSSNHVEQIPDKFRISKCSIFNNNSNINSWNTWNESITLFFICYEIRITSILLLNVLPLPRLNSTSWGLHEKSWEFGVTFVVAWFALSMSVMVKNWRMLKLGHMWNTLMRSLKFAIWTFK